MPDDRDAAMREAFDRAFAEPPQPSRRDEVELLRVRIGGRSFVVAVADIASIHADLRITPLPAVAGSGALGVVALRGAIVPVYDLRVLLGIPGSDPLRWLAIAAGNGYAFEALDGFVRVPARPARGGAIVHDGRPHPLVELAAPTRREDG